jgi:hypothetical protein
VNEESLTHRAASVEHLAGSIAIAFFSFETVAIVVIMMAIWRYLLSMWQL